jgi:hypothetical protein
MRKTIMLGTVIALFAVGALAQANDLTTTEQKSSAEASNPTRRQWAAKETHAIVARPLTKSTVRAVRATANTITKRANGTMRAGNSPRATDAHRNIITDGTLSGR